MRKCIYSCLLCLLVPLSSWAIEDGTYYLYNVGAGMFLDHGGSDNYHACFKPHGAPVILKSTGTDTYTIQTNVDKTAYLAADGTVYTNTSGVNFTISPSGEGTYTISVSGAFFGYGGTTDPLLSQTVVSTNLDTGGGNNILWKVMSQADMEAEFANATATSPVDATFYIKCANFNRHDKNLAAWSNFVKDQTSGNCSSYLYNNCGYYYGTSTDANQVLTGLKAGQYKLKCQGFYCHGAVASVGTTYTKETMPKKAVLYAGTSTTPLEGILDDVSASKIYTTGQAVTGGYIPTLNTTNSNDAVEAFDNGLYTDNVVYANVGADGTLSIGIKMEDGITGSYIAYDNFELYYMGAVTTITDEMVQNLLATVPTGTMSTATKAAMDSAVDALKANATADTYKAADESIAAAKANAQAYVDVKAAMNKAAATTLSDDAKATYTAAVASIASAYEGLTLEGDGTTEVAAIEAALQAAVNKDLETQSDRTSLIQNPQFDEGTTGWSGDFGNGAQKGSGNYVITSYGGGFDIYQTLTGIQPGIYKLSVQAFSRPTSNDDTWTAYQAGTSLVNETYIYANDSKKKVPLIVEDYMTESQSSGSWSTYTLDGKSIYVPNNSGAFSVAFSAGLYENDLYCIVGEDGVLKFGIKNLDSDNSTSYAGYDNFRLTYIGSCDMTEKIANPQFDEGTTGWSGDFGNGAKKGSGNYVITSYGGGFDIYQTLTDMIPGTYKLQVQAFSRPTSNDDTWTAYQAGNSLVNETYIYGNAAQQKVKLIVEDYMTSSQSSGTWSTYTLNGSSVYVPNNSGAFSVAFSAGLYENEVLCTVDETGILKIGVKNLDSSNSVSYAGYDNFRLTYISTDYTSSKKSDEETIDDINSDLAAYKAIAEQATDHAAFDAVYAEAVATIGSATEVTSEITEAKAKVFDTLKSLMKTGDTTNGQFDVTGLIKSADFAKNADGWDQEKSTFTWNSIGVVQVSGSTAADKLSQTLSDMPAGKYTLKVQGFYQPQAWKQAEYDYEHGKNVQKASLFLNDQSKYIKSIFQDTRATLASACISRTEDVGGTIDGRGFPLLMSKVSEALTPGGYWNYIEANVAEDGDVTFGVNLEETTLDGSWTILDNFRLYYGDRKVETVKSNSLFSIADDTPADVIIKKTFVADSLYAFCAPCDIPGSNFKAVYEIGSLDPTTKTAVVYPVENVRAGIPCYVEVATAVDSIYVKNTVLKAETADVTPVIWDGCVYTPYYRTLSWRSTSLKKVANGAAYYKNIIKQDLNNMNFTANIENYQVRMFMDVTYDQSSSSVVSTYNAVSPARRDIAHNIGIPVPESKALGAVISYSLNSDMSDAKTVTDYYGAPVCYIANLVPGNTYYYTVSSNNEVVSKGQFNVEGPVRMMYAPSVYNLRDLGGWTVDDGRVTRYGLIYRGGEVNGYHAPCKDDLETLKDVGIAAELDLRYNDSYDQDRETNQSGYGFVKGDTYYFAGANDYTAANLSETATQARLKEEFEFVMKNIRQGRGVHFHCVFGADRTGFFAFLLEGLLGFNLNQMYHDYEFTSFAAPAGNRSKSAIQERIAVIQALSGSTLKAKFENYFLNKVKITQEQIDEFRELMLYDPSKIAEDVNKDGSVDSQDVLKVYDYMKNATAAPTSDTTEDVNQDSTVDSQDVLKIYEYMKAH